MNEKNLAPNVINQGRRVVIRGHYKNGKCGNFDIIGDEKRGFFLGYINGLIDVVIEGEDGAHYFAPTHVAKFKEWGEK